MAHVLKISQDKAASIIQHDFREHKCGENVDENLSNLNEYHVFQNSNAWEQYQTDLKNCKMQKRADVNTLASWIITLPKDIDVGTDEEKKFFDGARTFLQERYPNTYVGDAIHRDEPKSRPHMHYLFIPKVKEIKNEKVRDPATGKLKKTGKKIETGRYKISAKELLTRADLSSFHGDLNDYMKNILGREVGILNDSVKEAGGNLSLSEYRLKMERQDAIKKQQEYERQRLLLRLSNLLSKRKENLFVKELETEKAKLLTDKVTIQNAQNEILLDRKKNSEYLNVLNQKAVELNKKEKEYQTKSIALENERQSIQNREANLASSEKEITKTKDFLAQKAIQLQQEEINIQQRRESVNATLAAAETTLKNAKKREEIVSKREAAIAEIRPDIKATKLKHEIEELEAQLKSPEMKPKTLEEMEQIARGMVNPEYLELTKQLKELKKKLKTARNSRSIDEYKIDNDIRRVKDRMDWIKGEGLKPEEYNIANQKYLELQEEEAAKEQKRQEITSLLAAKKQEYEYNNSGAAAWLMENAHEWPLVAEKINEVRQEREAAAKQKSQQQDQPRQQQQMQKKGVERQRKRDDWSR